MSSGNTIFLSLSDILPRNQFLVRDFTGWGWLFRSG
jgi:hypothetical protein